MKITRHYTQGFTSNTKIWYVSASNCIPRPLTNQHTLFFQVEKLIDTFVKDIGVTAEQLASACANSTDLRSEHKVCVFQKMEAINIIIGAKATKPTLVCL